MGHRRKARELAMQTLFYIDMTNTDAEEAMNNFVANFTTSGKKYSFFMQLVKGVREASDEIDALIERFSENWKIFRMAGVDRNILRVGVYELLYCEDIPAKVTINEAIDISKKFGTEESGAFINGILDNINKELETE